MSRLTEGRGYHHVVRAQRHLEKHCDELWFSSIAKCANEKIKMKQKHKEEVTAKVEQHQIDVALGNKRKRGGGTQQKTH